MNKKPNIPGYLLWEYDLDTFNYEKSYKVVIERILIRGTIEDWTEMLNFYPLERVLETVAWTKQIDRRDKDFALLFIQSDLIHVA